jgi:hypothetical protein
LACKNYNLQFYSGSAVVVVVVVVVALVDSEDIGGPQNIPVWLIKRSMRLAVWKCSSRGEGGWLPQVRHQHWSIS